MTKLQQLRSELKDNLELYDWVISKIKEITVEIESMKKEGVVQ
jgi:hypothetical protein